VKRPGEFYSVSTWDHEKDGWEHREECDRHRLPRLLRELREEAWDRPSVLVRRLPGLPPLWDQAQRERAELIQSESLKASSPVLLLPSGLNPGSDA
jgi:hypothetical protein